MKNLFLSIFLCVSFGLFAQQKDWETHKTAKYQIQYPNNWILVDGKPNKEFFLIAQLESDLDTFKENITLAIFNYEDTKMTLDCFVNDSVDRIETHINSARILENIRDKKKSYHKVIYQSEVNERSLKTLQHYWMVKQRIYILAFTAETSIYESYIEQVSQIFKSFKIL